MDIHNCCLPLVGSAVPGLPGPKRGPATQLFQALPVSGLLTLKSMLAVGPGESLPEAWFCFPPPAGITRSRSLAVAACLLKAGQVGGLSERRQLDLTGSLAKASC